MEELDTQRGSTKPTENKDGDTKLKVVGGNQILLVQSKAVTQSVFAPGFLGQGALLCAVAWRLAHFQIKTTLSPTFNNLVTVCQPPLSCRKTHMLTVSFSLIRTWRLLSFCLFLVFQSLVGGAVLYLLKGKWLTALIVAIVSPARVSIDHNQPLAAFI